jgi:hypothetical protein
VRCGASGNVEWFEVVGAQGWEHTTLQPCHTAGLGLQERHAPIFVARGWR